MLQGQMLRMTLVAGLCGLLAGCAPGGLQEGCSRRLNSIDPPPPAVVLTGPVATVEMTLPIIVVCPAGAPEASGVTTGVLDGVNAAVPSSATPPSTSTEGYSTSMSFTPDSGGVYTLSATFEPSIGSSQRQVQVVSDLSAAPPLDRADACSSFERLETAVICRRAGSLEVRRAGAAVQTLTAEASLAAGRVLWVWAQGNVTRYEDTGAGPLVGTGSAPFPDARSATVGAEADRVLAVTGAASALAYQELRAADAGLAARTLALPGPGPSSTSGLLPVDANTIAYGATNSTLCVISLAPLAASCTPIDLQVYDREGEVLWVRGLADDPSVGYLRVQLGAPAVTLMTARAPDLLTDPRLNRPVFRWASRSVFPRLPDLVLESWGPQGEGTTAGVGQGVVWFVDAAGAGTVFERGP
jgi:hypothetical protein